MVQHVIEKGKSIDRDAIVSKVKGQVLVMSRHKFASNVVEKCFAFSSTEDKETLVQEIVHTKADGSNALTVMMKDQFANYVVQKMLDVVTLEQRELLLSKIRPQLHSLKKFTYGKHLIASKTCIYILKC